MVQYQTMCIKKCCALFIKHNRNICFGKVVSVVKLLPLLKFMNVRGSVFVLSEFDDILLGSLLIVFLRTSLYC